MTQESSRLDQLEHDLETAHITLREKDKAIEKLTHSNDQLKVDLKKALDDLDSLRKEKDEVISILKQKINTIREAGFVNQGNEDEQSIIHTLQKSIIEKDSKFEQLKARSRELYVKDQEKIRTLEEQLSRLESQVSQIQNHSGSENTIVLDLRRQLEDKNAIMTQIKEKAKTLYTKDQETIASLKREIEEFKNEAVRQRTPQLNLVSDLSLTGLESKTKDEVASTLLSVLKENSELKLSLKNLQTDESATSVVSQDQKRVGKEPTKRNHDAENDQHLDSEHTIQNLTKEIQELRLKVAQIDLEKGEIIHQNQELIEALKEKARSKIIELNLVIKANEETITALKQRNAELDKRLSDFEVSSGDGAYTSNQGMTALQEELNLMKKSRDDEVTKLSETIEALKSMARSKMLDLKDQNEGLKREKENYVDQMVEKDNIIAGLRDSLTKMEQLSNDASKKEWLIIQEHQKEYTALKSSMESAETEFKMQIMDLEEEKDMLLQKLAEYERAQHMQTRSIEIAGHVEQIEESDQQESKTDNTDQQPLQTQVVSLQQNSCDQKEAINSLTQEVKTLKLDNESLKLHVKDLQIERDELMKVRSTLCENYNKVQNDLTILSEIMVQRESRIASLQKELNEERSSKILLDSQVSTLKASIDLERETKFMEGEALVIDLKAKLDAALKEKDAVMAKYSCHAENTANPKASVTELEAIIASLESEREHLHNQLSEVEFDISKTRQHYEAAIVDLKSQIDAIKREKDAVVSQLHDMISGIRAEKDEIVEENRRMKDTMAQDRMSGIPSPQTQSKLIELETALSILKADMESLEKNKVDEIARMSESLLALRSDSEMTVHKLKNHITALTKEKEDLQIQVLSLEQTLAKKYENVIEEYKNRADTTTKQNEELLAQVSRFDLIKEKAKETILELRQRVGRLEKESSALKEELARIGNSRNPSLPKMSKDFPAEGSQWQACMQSIDELCKTIQIRPADSSQIPDFNSRIGNLRDDITNHLHSGFSRMHQLEAELSSVVLQNQSLERNLEEKTSQIHLLHESLRKYGDTQTPEQKGSLATSDTIEKVFEQMEKDRLSIDEIYVMVSSLDLSGQRSVESVNIEQLFQKLGELYEKKETILNSLVQKHNRPVPTGYGPDLSQLQSKVAILEGQLKDKDVEIAQMRIESKVNPSLGQKFTDLSKQVVSPAFFSKRDSVTSVPVKEERELIAPIKRVDISGVSWVYARFSVSGKTEESWMKLEAFAEMYPKATIPPQDKITTKAELNEEQLVLHLAPYKERMSILDSQLREAYRLIDEKEEEFKKYKAKAQTAIKSLNSKQQNTLQAQQYETQIAELQSQNITYIKQVHELEIQNRSMNDQLSRFADLESRYTGLLNECDRQKAVFAETKSQYEDKLSVLRNQIAEKESEKKDLVTEHQLAIKKLEEQQNERTEELRSQINKVRERNRHLVEEKDKEIAQLREKVKQMPQSESSEKLYSDTLPNSSPSPATATPSRSAEKTKPTAMGLPTPASESEIPPVLESKRSFVLPLSNSRPTATPVMPTTPMRPMDMIASGQREALVDMFTRELEDANELFNKENGSESASVQAEAETERLASQSIASSMSSRRMNAASLINAPINPDQELLHLAQLQAQRDSEIQTARDTIQKLIDAVAVHEERESALLMQEHRLRNEIENLKRAKKREDVPMEYLKNIMIKYLQTNDIEALLPVLSTLLQFSPDEITRIRKSRTQRPGAYFGWGAKS